MNLFVNWTIIVCFIICGYLEAVSIVDHYPDEYIEHEVIYEEAIAEARNLKLYPGPIPGCKPCTQEEMTYCSDGSVVKDHCCCDAGYNEVLPFVQHTCRIEQEACKLQADDCAEYSRLRECCCHAYLGSYWKYMAGGAGRTTSSISIILILTMLLKLLL